MTRAHLARACAIERLGVVVPQKASTRKYVSRTVMGRYTGNRDETVDAIRDRIRGIFGMTLEDAAASWLAMLRA